MLKATIRKVQYIVTCYEVMFQEESIFPDTVFKGFQEFTCQYEANVVKAILYTIRKSEAVLNPAFV